MPQITAECGKRVRHPVRPGQKLLPENAKVIKSSTCHRGAGGEIRKQKAPRGKNAEDWRQRFRSVGVKRSRRSGELCEAAHAEADQKSCRGSHQVDEPRGVAGEREDQRDGERRQKCWAPWPRPTAPAFLPDPARPRAGRIFGCAVLRIHLAFCGRCAGHVLAF